MPAVRHRSHAGPAPLSVFRLSGDDRLLLSRFFVRRGGDAECQSAKNACRAQSAEREVPVAFGPHRLRRTGGNGASCFGRMCGIACRVMPAVRHRPPCSGPLLSRFFGCPGVAARISPRARAFPPRCRTAGPCAFLSEGRSGRGLRNAPRGWWMNRGPHGSEEPQSAAAFRNRPDSLSGLYEKSYSSETDAGVAADEWRPARSKGAANLRFAGCRFADGGGIVKRDEKTIPLRRVLAGIACFGACGFGSTVPCSAEKAPVSPPGLIGFACCQGVRLRLNGAVQCGKSTCFSVGS